MSDIIHLLPDSVANQIAAGEVIQRPASVVKELVENSLDAQSTAIKVNLKNTGKTLVQVIDNGIGMSETDARTSFERHATSKIQNVHDLFAICTMGFRGEALASIASIAQVELKTRQKNTELGTQLKINGSKLESQETVNCPEGSNLLVKNLFFNIPARRKFLKADTTELRHIINEIQRIVIPNSHISFELIHNGNPIISLSAENPKQRIVNLIGGTIKPHLLDLKTETNLIKINGFICKPEYAKKTYGEQYLFVNNRFIKHPYFHKAITQAYSNLLAKDTIPSYFIFFETDPKTIDINIHPTKTEIKFQEERFIWQIINSTVRQTLGKFNITPTIDFDTQDAVSMPIINTKTAPSPPPNIKIDSNFNPFKKEKQPPPYPSSYKNDKPSTQGWEKLYDDFTQEANNPNNIQIQKDEQPEQQNLLLKHQEPTHIPINFLQIKNKYVLTSVKSGIMIIDQRKAHIRILFEKFCKKNKNKSVVQKTLYPTTIVLDPSNSLLLHTILEQINTLGFDIKEFGKQTFMVNGLPAELDDISPKEIIEKLLEDYKTGQRDLKMDIHEKIALSLAKSSAIQYGKSLSQIEISQLIGNLFSCEIPNYTPDGKSIIYTLKLQEIDNLF